MKLLDELQYLEDPFLDEDEQWSDDLSENEQDDIYSDSPFDFSYEF